MRKPDSLSAAPIEDCGFFKQRGDGIGSRFRFACVFSGGEQQKTAIARAVYKDAGLMVLDEPTAALDPYAEYEVYKNFSEITESKTLISISHRLSSCRMCDIYYMVLGGSPFVGGSALVLFPD